MTKRFELKMEENKWYFYDNVEDDYIYSKHSVCRLLNTLHQENTELKKVNQDLFDNLQEAIGKLGIKIGAEKRLKECQEENKQLKKILYDTISKCEEWYGNDYPNAIFKVTLTLNPKMYNEIRMIIEEEE